MSEPLKYAPVGVVSKAPLCGLFGESGGGKTETALRLARGFAGPTGKIAILDSDAGRSGYHKDIIPGGFDQCIMHPPFSPERYAEAVAEAEKAGYKALVIDCFSDEWAGPGGYLEQKEIVAEKMADGQDFKLDACRFAAIARVKPIHNRLIAQLSLSPMPIILCFQGKKKTRMVKTEVVKDGATRTKNTPTQDEEVSAIQESGIIYKCLFAGEVYAREEQVAGRTAMVGGYFRCIKYTVGHVLDLLPKDNEKFTIEHGAAIIAWCMGQGASSVQTPTVDPALAALFKELRGLTVAITGKGVDANAKLEAYLKEKGIITATDTLKQALTVATLPDIIAKVKINLAEMKEAQGELIK